jgi:hypothetical protein
MAAADLDAPNAWLHRWAPIAAATGVALLAACDASVVSVGAWLPETTGPVTTADAFEASSDAAGEAASLDDAESLDASLDMTGPADIGIVDESSGLYLEAESGLLSGGYTIGDDPMASGGKYIAPPPGPASDAQPGTARARYDFEITTPGRYIIWGRLQTPDPLHNRSWIQVDGGNWYMWRITTGDIWYWFHIHDNTNYYTPIPFALAAGPHTMIMAKAADGAWVDRFYITAGGDMPPQTDTQCRPPNSIAANGGCMPSCGSLGGQTCGGPQCAGRQLVTRPVYDCPVCCY